jgi:hypothetical protein
MYERTTALRTKLVDNLRLHQAGEQLPWAARVRICRAVVGDFCEQ